MAVSDWINKLITKEDPYHIHQVLGLLVLLSYAWRFSTQGGDGDFGFASHPELTLPTIALHMALHLSSFQFTIPSQRIKDGSRQWPEYRLHAFVFAAGSFGAIFINHYEQFMAQTTDTPNYHLNYLLVLARLILADVSSASVDKPSRTIRDLQAPVAAKYYFSATQFFVTSFVLLGIRRCSLFFYFGMVIQVTGFQMTLRRKNLVSLPVNLLIYGGTLGGGFFVGVYELLIRTHGDWLPVYVVTAMGCLAAVWRMGPLPEPLRNKYLIWTTMHFGVVEKVLRPAMERREDALLNPNQVQTLAFAMLAIMLLNGVFKHYSSSQPAKSKKDSKQA